VPLEERCVDLALQLERQEEVHMESATVLSERVQACEDGLQEQGDFIHNELPPRFEKVDDGLLAQKMDVEGLQITATEINTRKANRTELAELQKRVDAVAEIQTRDSATLEEAQQNLEKLHECITMANDNKTQTQALWKIFREESQEVRDWASRGFSELRAATRIKMDEAAALNCLDELRAELRNNTMHLAEASARVESGIRNKAEAGDLIRLEDTVHRVQTDTTRPKQLLIGTKCLACDRPALDEVTLDGALHAAEDLQKEQLFRQVKRIISRDAGQDVLNFVSVHVGSPTRVAGVTGGCFEARDTRDHSPGSHALTATSSRGRQMALASRQNTETAAPPERAPPRVQPPLVRLTPRRPRTEPDQRYGSLAPSTLRDTLGSGGQRRRRRVEDEE